MERKIGKRKQVKRSNMNNQEASSSSSRPEKNKMVGENIVLEDKDRPVEKKLKKETKSFTEDQVEVEKSFDDLPTEMMMKILKKLDDADLFRYRLVNRQWNGVASEILQTNAGAEIQFEFTNALRIVGKPKKSFRSLIKSFKDSPNFPYSRLRFMQVQHSFFTNEDWLELVAYHGNRIKCLKLGIKENLVHNELIQLTNELRNLLLNQLPNLQQFGIQFSPKTISSKIQLFPKTTANSETVRLPHLKVLYLDQSSFTRQSEIVTVILHAAVELQKIELFRRHYGLFEPREGFYFLHSLGKLPLLQNASIDVTHQLLSTVKEKCTTFPEFKLKELELHWSFYIIEDFWPQGTLFLSNLFKSSKDTLTKLEMTRSLGFLTELKLPTFSKLTSLNIKNTEGVKFFLDGLNFKEIFPVLNSLELNLSWASAVSDFSDLLSLSSLETLHVSSGLINSNSVAQINSMCVNLTNFEIRLRSLNNFPQVTKGIWIHLTKLHSLEFHISMDYSNSDDDHAIDSCITGISKQDCKRLYHLNIADKELELSGSQWKIPRSEWKIKRENASILNLKGLRKFTLHLISKRFERRTSKMAMTCVSEKYALELMDNLTYNIQREKTK